MKKSKKYLCLGFAVILLGKLIWIMSFHFLPGQTGLYVLTFVGAPIVMAGVVIVLWKSEDERSKEFWEEHDRKEELRKIAFEKREGLRKRRLKINNFSDQLSKIKCQ